MTSEGAKVSIAWLDATVASCWRVRTGCAFVPWLSWRQLLLTLVPVVDCRYRESLAALSPSLCKEAALTWWTSWTCRGVTSWRRL